MAKNNLEVPVLCLYPDGREETILLMHMESEYVINIGDVVRSKIKDQYFSIKNLKYMVPAFPSSKGYYLKRIKPNINKDDIYVLGNYLSSGHISGETIREPFIFKLKNFEKDWDISPNKNKKNVENTNWKQSKYGSPDWCSHLPGNETRRLIRVVKSSKILFENVIIKNLKTEEFFLVNTIKYAFPLHAYSEGYYTREITKNMHANDTYAIGYFLNSTDPFDKKTNHLSAISIDEFESAWEIEVYPD